MKAIGGYAGAQLRSPDKPVPSGMQLSVQHSLMMGRMLFRLSCGIAAGSGTGTPG